MSDVATIENAAMERREAMDTRPQDRYAGRGKFNFCRQCGRVDGMSSVHRTALAASTRAALAPTTWYSKTGNDEYLFYACPRCNRDKIIPDGFMSVMTSILIWAYFGPQPDCNPMQQEIQDNE